MHTSTSSLPMCSRPPDRQVRPRLAPLALALIVIGLTSITAQVLIIREIGAVFYGNELSMGIILAVWLLSVAAGAWLPGHFVDHVGRSDSLLSLGLAAAGLLPIFQLLFIRTARWWLNLTPGALAGLGNITLTIVIVLFPLCFCLGLLFRLGARLFAESGQSVAAAYAWEAAGAALGGILFAFVLARWGNSFGIALLLATVNWGAASYVQMRSRFIVSRYVYFLSSILGLMAVLLASDSWNHTSLCWQYPNLLFAADSVYGRVAVTGRDSQRVFYENGLVMFDTQSLAAEETVHLPLLAHPSPHRLLLMGGGVGGSLREALKHPLESIDYVELDALIIETAHQFLPPEDAKWLDDPRVNIINQDGRVYLSIGQNDRPTPRDRSTPATQYDTIVIDLPEPSTGQLNRFYTLEFYRLARAVLAPNGILAFGLPSSENYLNRELRRRNGSIYATLREVFPHVIILPGDRNVFLASGIPISDNPEIWTARLYERGLQTKQVNSPYLRFLLTT